MAIKRISENDLIENGLKYINDLDKFEYSYISYGDKSGAKFISLIKDKGFVIDSTRSEGRDFEICVYIFRKKTQQEKDFENLALQISQLEKRFNIKITYTNKL